MKCVICRQGETQPGHTTVTLERGDSVIVFKQVPAQVCRDCGEAYVDRQVSRELLGTAEEEVRSGVKMAVREFVAASV